MKSQNVTYKMEQKRQVPGGGFLSLTLFTLGIVSIQLSYFETLSPRYSNRALASVPDPFEDLRFKTLEGKYMLYMENGRVREIEFVDADHLSDRPKYLSNLEEFLENNKTALAVEFASFKPSFTDKVGENSIQNYDLFDEKNKKVGSLSVKTDPFERMLSMRFTGITTK